MPAHKYAKAKKISSSDMKIELIEVADSSADAETRSDRVQECVAKMILLGGKMGRPKKESEEVFYEKAS